MEAIETRTDGGDDGGTIVQKVHGDFVMQEIERHS
jgi:hypothetical protein